MATYSILTISGRGLPVTVDADGYDTALAASEMAAAEHDGKYAIVAEDAEARDYDSNEDLDGPVSAELAAESAAAGDTGAVPAYRDADGVWRYVRPDRKEDYRRSGHDVRTVFVEAEEEEEVERTVVKAERGRAQCATCGDLATRTPIYIDGRDESREADEACARCGSHDIAHWLPEAE